jgi:hypothetical protein
MMDKLIKLHTADLTQLSKLMKKQSHLHSTEPKRLQREETPSDKTLKRANNQTKKVHSSKVWLQKE